MGTVRNYSEDEYLMLSGIQHYIFCRRQWALIHVENQWQENVLTIEGEILHERCHNDMLREKRKGLLITRGMRVYSASMGVTGQCDVVEFHQGKSGALLYGWDGYWKPIPIEYKHGHEKADFSDMAQLCAQAICLEEMLCCEVESGFLYYDEIHRREEVLFDKKLRDFVKKSFDEMHDYYRCGYTLREKYSKKCNHCSLKDVCLPKISEKASVKEYYERFLED